MWGWPIVDSGRKGAVGGGAPHLLVVGVWAVVHSLFCSIGVRLLSAKLQPSWVSTVAVVDMLVGRCWLLGVFFVELADDVG